MTLYSGGTTLGTGFSSMNDEGLRWVTSGGGQTGAGGIWRDIEANGHWGHNRLFMPAPAGVQAPKLPIPITVTISSSYPPLILRARVKLTPTLRVGTTVGHRGRKSSSPPPFCRCGRPGRA